MTEFGAAHDVNKEKRCEHSSCNIEQEGEVTPARQESTAPVRDLAEKILE